MFEKRARVLYSAVEHSPVDITIHFRQLVSVLLLDVDDITRDEEGRANGRLVCHVFVFASARRRYHLDRSVR